MVIDGCYICGEHSLTLREDESLCCTPEINVALCVNSKKNFYSIFGLFANAMRIKVNCIKFYVFVVNGFQLANAC